jgi:hypothetical protein
MKGTSSTGALSALARQPASGLYFAVTSDGALRMKMPPPGWRVYAVDGNGKMDYVVLERERGQSLIPVDGSRAWGVVASGTPRRPPAT